MHYFGMVRMVNVNGRRGVAPLRQSPTQGRRCVWSWIYRDGEMATTPVVKGVARRVHTPPAVS